MDSEIKQMRQQKITTVMLVKFSKRDSAHPLAFPSDRPSAQKVQPRDCGVLNTSNYNFMRDPSKMINGRDRQSGDRDPRHVDVF